MHQFLSYLRSYAAMSLFRSRKGDQVEIAGNVNRLGPVYETKKRFINNIEDIKV